MTRIFADGQALIEERLDGRTIYRNSIALPDNPPDIFERLCHWALTGPDRALLSDPAGAGRRRITYGEALARARALKRQLAVRFGLRKGTRPRRSHGAAIKPARDCSIARVFFGAGFSITL